MARCRASVTLKVSATASPISTAPATIRTPRCRVRNARTRSATPRPASAKISSGNAVPTAKARVSATVVTPIRPVAPATVIAASTGPAHGTYTAPRARPSTKPPWPEPTRRCGIQVNGRSSRSWTRGTIMATPTSTSTTRPTQRMMSLGSGSTLRNRVPSSVNAAKLRVSPATTRYGRDPGPRDGPVAGSGPADGGPDGSAPGAVAAVGSPGPGPAGTATGTGSLRTAAPDAASRRLDGAPALAP